MAAHLQRAAHPGHCSMYPLAVTTWHRLLSWHARFYPALQISLLQIDALCMCRTLCLPLVMELSTSIFSEMMKQMDIKRCVDQSGSLIVFRCQTLCSPLAVELSTSISSMIMHKQI